MALDVLVRRLEGTKREVLNVINSLDLDHADVGNVLRIATQNNGNRDDVVAALNDLLDERDAVLTANGRIYVSK